MSTVQDKTLLSRGWIFKLRNNVAAGCVSILAEIITVYEILKSMKNSEHGISSQTSHYLRNCVCSNALILFVPGQKVHDGKTTEERVKSKKYYHSCNWIV